MYKGICLFVSTFTDIHVYARTHTHTHTHANIVYVCECVCACACVWLSLHVRHSVKMLIVWTNICVCVCICLSVCLSAHVCLSACLPVRLSVCLCQSASLLTSHSMRVSVQFERHHYTIWMTYRENGSEMTFRTQTYDFSLIQGFVSRRLGHQSPDECLYRCISPDTSPDW